MSRTPGPASHANKPRTWEDNHSGFSQYRLFYIELGIIDPLMCDVGGFCARSVSYTQLAQVMKLSIAQRDESDYHDYVKWTLADMILPLNMTMDEFGMNLSVKRQAGFLAQMAHESTELSDWTENVPKKTAASKQKTDTYFNDKYSNNKSIGNEGGNDGERFRGRGPIQITGRDNYTRFGKWLLERDHPALKKKQLKAMSNPMLEHPELVAEDIVIGFLAAGWHWSKSRGTDTNLKSDQLTLNLKDPHERNRFDALSTFVNKYDADSFGKRWNYYKQCVAVLTTGRTTN